MITRRLLHSKIIIPFYGVDLMSASRSHHNTFKGLKYITDLRQRQLERTRSPKQWQTQLTCRDFSRKSCQVINTNTGRFGLQIS